MTDRELMQQALEALEYAADHIGCPDDDDAIGVARKALRERLAQPEQEPVAWKDRTYGNLHHQNFGNSIPLYTSPPASKPWVGLTDEEVWEMDAYKMAITDQETQWLYRFARAIEAKLKEKNA